MTEVADYPSESKKQRVEVDNVGLIEDKVAFVFTPFIQEKPDVNLKWCERVFSSYLPCAAFSYEMVFPQNCSIPFDLKHQEFTYSIYDRKKVLSCLVIRSPKLFMAAVVRPGDVILKVNDVGFTVPPGEEFNMENMLNKLDDLRKEQFTIRFLRVGGMASNFMPSPAEILLFQNDKNVAAKFGVMRDGNKPDPAIVDGVKPKQNSPVIQLQYLDQTLPVSIKKMMQGSKVTWEHVPVFNNSTSLSSNTTHTNAPFVPCSTNAFSNQMTIGHNPNPYSSFTGHFVVPSHSVHGPIKSAVTVVPNLVAPPETTAEVAPEPKEATATAAAAEEGVEEMTEKNATAETTKTKMDELKADDASVAEATPSTSTSASTSAEVKKPEATATEKKEGETAGSVVTSAVPASTSGTAAAKPETAVKLDTKFAGVFRDRNKWMAVLEVPLEQLAVDAQYNIQTEAKNKQIMLGRYDTLEEARLVYKKAESDMKAVGNFSQKRLARYLKSIAPQAPAAVVSAAAAALPASTTVSGHAAPVIGTDAQLIAAALGNSVPMASGYTGAGGYKGTGMTKYAAAKLAAQQLTAKQMAANGGLPVPPPTTSEIAVQLEETVRQVRATQQSLMVQSGATQWQPQQQQTQNFQQQQQQQQNLQRVTTAPALGQKMGGVAPQINYGSLQPQQQQQQQQALSRPLTQLTPAGQSQPMQQSNNSYAYIGGGGGQPQMAPALNVGGQSQQYQQQPQQPQQQFKPQTGSYYTTQGLQQGVPPSNVQNGSQSTQQYQMSYGAPLQQQQQTSSMYAPTNTAYTPYTSQPLQQQQQQPQTMPSQQTTTTTSAPMYQQQYAPLSGSQSLQQGMHQQQQQYFPPVSGSLPQQQLGMYAPAPTLPSTTYTGTTGVGASNTGYAGQPQSLPQYTPQSYQQLQPQSQSMLPQQSGQYPTYAPTSQQLYGTAPMAQNTANTLPMVSNPVGGGGGYVYQTAPGVQQKLPTQQPQQQR